MKKALIPATLALASGIAIAAGPGFTQVDTNQDGALSQEEASLVEGLDFEAVDQDKNGVLSIEEYTAAVGG